MKAEEYYEEIKEFVKYPHFTKLTSTGIDPDYKSIFEFAEAYHEAATKASEADTSDDKCTLHDVSNNEALESSEGVAVKGCHNCKNNPHAPFVPEICDSCYADRFDNWQPLTDC